MANPTKSVSRRLFTPSTLPQPGVPDRVVTFIEDALLAIANRQEFAALEISRKATGSGGDNGGDEACVGTAPGTS